jgi:hypothetical protein
MAASPASSRSTLASRPCADARRTRFLSQRDDSMKRTIKMVPHRGAASGGGGHPLPARGRELKEVADSTVPACHISVRSARPERATKGQADKKSASPTSAAHAVPTARFRFLPHRPDMPRLEKAEGPGSDRVPLCPPFAPAVNRDRSILQNEPNFPGRAAFGGEISARPRLHS